MSERDVHAGPAQEERLWAKQQDHIAILISSQRAAQCGSPT